LHAEIAKDASEWNSVVELSPFSVLHHRYEVCIYQDKAVPLAIKASNCRFLLPLRIIELSRGLRLAFSPVYYYASLLPEDEKTLDSLPEALDFLCRVLSRAKIDYFSTCAPIFISKRYASILNSWLCAHGASVQVAYNHMIRIGNRTFEEIKKQVLKKHAREKIRKAEREGIVFVRIDTEESIHEWIDDIYRCNLSALERQGRKGAYPDSYRDVYLSELVKTKRNLGDGFTIYGAVFDGRLVSYMIVQEFGRLMQATKAMSDTRYLRKCPNDALIANIIREGCERGFGWFEYGFDRVKIGGRVPSLHSSINEFKFKFGFEEVPLFIYRLGLTYSGKLLQHVFSMREYAIASSAYVPESLRNFLWRFYGPRRRRFSAFLYT
jgi:hypothetical protein